MSRRYKNTVAPVPAPVPERRCAYSDAGRTAGTARDASGRRVDFRIYRGARGRVVEIQAGDVTFKNL